MNTSSKDLSVAKQLRDRRRRETRTTTTTTTTPPESYPPTTTNSATMMSGESGSFQSSATTARSRSSGNVSGSNADTAQRRISTNDNNNGIATTYHHQDLLNQSHELSEQASIALRMAQRATSSTNDYIPTSQQSDSSTTMNPTTSLASRRLPTTTAAALRRPITGVTQQQPQQQQPRLTHASSSSTSNQRPIPPPSSSFSSSTIRTTTPLQTADNRDTTTVPYTKTTSASLPIVPERRTTSQGATTTESTTLPKTTTTTTRGGGRDDNIKNESEIITLETIIPKLGRYAPYSTQRQELIASIKKQQLYAHPLAITHGTTVRLRMMSTTTSTCPFVLGCDTNKNKNDKVHIMSNTTDDTTTMMCCNFLVQNIQWPYESVLCYGDYVALCRQQTLPTTTSSTSEQQHSTDSPRSEYLQVTATQNRDATVANSSSSSHMWDITVQTATVPDAWHVWTVLPYFPDNRNDNNTQSSSLSSLPIRLGYTATQTQRVRSSGVPIHQGTPVILRHVKTGGVLSLEDNNNDDDGGVFLTLRTDALTSAGNILAHDDASSTMDRLQRHDLLVPTPREAVWLEPTTVPLSLPEWQFHSRLFLQGDYLSQDTRHDGKNGAEASTPLSIPNSSSLQTKALVDQLLGSFFGLEGKLVKYTTEGRFVVSGCDANLTKLATDLVSLSNDFATVRCFVAAQYPGYPFGRVRQALGGALDACLQEYLQQISVIETRYRQEGNDFGLHKLGVLVQSPRDCLAVLRQVVIVAEHHVGGALLNALRKLQMESYHGDALGQNILDQLLGECGRPYLSMLQQWLEDGTLDDKHGEFMVQQSQSASKEWEDYFIVRPEHVLEGFFSTCQTRDQVLPTGRYWQAIKSCQSTHKKKAAPMTDFSLTYNSNPAQGSAYIHQQYLEASRELSRLLKVDYDLMGTLKLIKRYYLLDQGDFFVNFMDAAEEDLYVPREKISLGRLQHWLGLSVQLTEHKSDEAWVASPSRTSQELKPTANELRCKLADYGLIDRLDRLHRETGGIDTSNPGTPQRRIYGSGDDEQAGTDGRTGVDIFCIELPRVPSPLNLILSPKHMNDYQLLFRSLFFAKHVERRLVSVWRDHLTLKELPSLRGSMGRTFLLRQRMLHCLQHLIYYMMFEVIEPNWTELEKKIKGTSSDSKEQTVDDILMFHGQFLERTLEACLITSRELLSSLMRLMRTCLLFADQMKLFMKSIGINEDRHKLALEKQKVVQQGLHNWDTSRRNNQKGLHKTLRKDYLDRQQRVFEHTRRVEREVTLSTYTAMIGRHEEVFSQQLREFMNLLSKSDDLYHTQKVNLCISLDYNGFAQASGA